jgi:OOP family OmpA-OmpF porin
MRLINYLLMMGLMVLILGSCAHRVEKADIPEDSNVSAEVRILENSLNDAKSRQVNLLSPDYFKRAENSFDQARKDWESKEPDAAVLDDIAYGIAYLDKAEEIARIARADMSAVLMARDKAVKAQAMVYLPSKLNDIDKDLKDLTEEYERVNTKIKRASVKDRTMLQNQYLGLESEARTKR